MNTFKVIGFAGIASVALAISANSPTLAETQADQGAVKSNNQVHRVSHRLAAAEQYTVGTSSGYKWGQKARRNLTKDNWNGTGQSRNGYKWGNSSSTVVDVEQAFPSNNVEQTRNPWGRRDFSEQTRNPWGRRDFSEQTRNPWGRRDFSEQTRNPWGRR
jgi:hypothetical protein